MLQGANTRSDRTERSDRSDKSDNSTGAIEIVNSEVAANTVICLIQQTTYLLRHQLQSLEQKLIKGVGSPKGITVQGKLRKSEPPNQRIHGEKKTKPGLATYLGDSRN